ncbi:uncharacterized protein [Procambarus clarkii]|uniref:uncharacterized protein n=1 Tax=Procambarus clarkii TaxID=6728 RepID=UPI003743BD0D
MEVADKMKKTLIGHLTRQITKCQNLLQQSPVDYIELEDLLQVAESNFKHIKQHMNLYLTELYQTSISETELEDIVNDLAQHEDDVQVKLQPFKKQIAKSKLTTTSAAHPDPDVKLPQISIPTFSGNENEIWDDFWSLFVDAVDSKTNIPKTTKFTYLQRLLRNKALKVIYNITLTSDGYDLDVQLLKSNYDNKERTITILVQKLLDLPTANNSTDSLQTFRLELESLLKALSHKVQIQTAEWMTKVVVRRKLPRETLDKLSTMYNKTSLTINEITEGLYTLVERQRANQDGKSVSNFSTNSHHKPQRTATTVVKPDFNKSSPKWKSGNVGAYTVNPSNPVVSNTPTTSPTLKKCLFCNNEHLTYKCSTYPDHNTRVHRLQELHRGTRCTGPHDPNSCTVSLRMCPKGRHHYSLCGSD